MDTSPLIASTLQSVTLSAISSILAQAITAYREEAPLEIDWIPVIQFLLFTFLSTPPNIIWQEFLEVTFPAHAPSENQRGKHLKEKSATLSAPAHLSYRNTAIKFILDQTVGAAVNTLFFSTFNRSLRAATGQAPRITNLFKAIDYWTSSGAVDFTIIDFGEVWNASLQEFLPIIRAGWKLWPAVSLINFTLVKSVSMRNLVGSVAGVAWGVYICLASSS